MLKWILSTIAMVACLSTTAVAAPADKTITKDDKAVLSAKAIKAIDAAHATGKPTPAAHAKSLKSFCKKHPNHRLCKPRVKAPAAAKAKAKGKKPTLSHTACVGTPGCNCMLKSGHSGGHDCAPQEDVKTKAPAAK